MKKNFKSIAVLLVTLFVISGKVHALSVDLSVDKSNVHVGEDVTVKVDIKEAASWNIHINANGPVTCDDILEKDENGNVIKECMFSNTGCVINESDASATAGNVNKTFTATCKATGVGVISFYCDGDNDAVNSTDQLVELTGSKEVNVTEASSNNNLSALTIDGEVIQGFSADTTSYSLSVEKSSIVIGATAEDSSAKVGGTGTQTLKVGENKLEVKVVAESGSVKTYTINVTRIGGVDPVYYTIKYDSNNGSKCSPTSIKALEQTALGTLCKPSRSGYTFSGWYTAKKGGTIVTKDTIANKNMTIYAHWSKNVSNAKTGISTPVIGLLSIALISLIVLLVVRNKKASLE